MKRHLSVVREGPVVPAETPLPKCATCGHAAGSHEYHHGFCTVCARKFQRGTGPWCRRYNSADQLHPFEGNNDRACASCELPRYRHRN